MTRLEFAAAVLLLAAPAGAKKPARSAKVDPAPVTVADLDAQYQDAAARLFPDKADQAVFLYRIAQDPVMAADVRIALRKAKAAGGDAAAVNARLAALPAANGWKKDVGIDITKTRAVLDAGVHQPTPRTDYSDTPLVAALMAGLGKKTPDEVFALINKPENGGPLPIAPCAPTGGKTLDALKTAAAGQADATFTGAPCTGDQAKTPDPKTQPPPAKDPHPVVTTDPKANVSDLKTTTGDPPRPRAGTDNDTTAKKGGFLSGMFSMQSLAGAAVFGGMGALLGSFGGPAGMLIGGLLGAAVGFFLSRSSGANG